MDASAASLVDELPWSLPRKVNTRRGERIMRTARMTPEVRTAWKALSTGQDPRRDQLMVGNSGDLIWFEPADEAAVQRMREERHSLLRLAEGCGLSFGEAKTITTRFGPRRVSRAKANDRFLDLWDSAQSGLRSLGFALEPDKSRGLFVARYAKLPKNEEAVRMSRAAASDVVLPEPEGLSYMPFQKAGIEFCLDRRNALLADEMGLGKTVQAIGVANADPSVHRMLVVCPASLRLNWSREMARWLVRDMQVRIVGGKREPPPAGDCAAIIGYEDLVRDERVQGEKWDMLVLDEAHYCKNDRTKRSKAGLGVQADRCLMLTGTPVLNRPIELHALLRRLNPDEWNNRMSYAKRYCNAHQGRFGWDMSGASNLEELQDRLRSTLMVRRMKKDVLSELPSKQRAVVPLSLSGDAMKAASAACEALECFEDFLTGKPTPRPPPFDLISEMRLGLGMAKVDAVADMTVDMMGSVKKLVLFAHHINVVERLRVKLQDAGITVGVVMGETSERDRDACVRAFQEGDDPQVLIGTIGAAGVGLTLTASSHVAFAELPWRPADVTQAEDRCHRIGQRDCVSVRHYVLPHSLDERMAHLIITKQGWADQALDKDLAGKAAQDKCSGVRAEAVPSAEPELPEPSEGEVQAALSCLRILRDHCDGARSRDGMGFNKMNERLGRTLADLEGLTPKQFMVAKRMCSTHKRQLPKDKLQALNLSASGKKRRPDNKTTCP